MSNRVVYRKLGIIYILIFYPIFQVAPMHIVYYVTSHGYGHAVRTATICNAFSGDVRLTFRTALPERFFQEEVRREFDYAPAEFDCGCIQNDSLTTDVEKTLSRYKQLTLENEKRLDTEVTWCRERGVDVIVSDIPPFVFEVAAAAGIPSVAVTNFTWLDVYTCYKKDIDFNLDKMRRQYGLANLLLALAPALPMTYFRKRLDSAPVGRSGRSRRKEIALRNGFDPSRRIALIYFGHFGLNNIEWQRLERYGDWEFLGVFPLPNAPRNYHVIAKTDFPYQDVLASADMMIAKIGYCVTSECMLHGTPLLYIPRDDFAESPCLEKGIAQWGGGYRITAQDFQKLELGSILKHIARNGRAAPICLNGAAFCAREIERQVRTA
jgi:hypothetical protein